MRIFEAIQQKVVIYPGRFHPFHKGHAAVFSYLKQQHGRVFISTSNKVDPPKSPFTFAEKKQMMIHSGIPSSAIVQTKNPYQAVEITQNYDPENTIVIFAVSEKDMAEDPRFSFKPKKDGSPSYFQPLKSDNLLPFSKHGYITTVPTLDFTVLGEPMRSATELRANFSRADDDTQKQMIVDLYGTYDPQIHNIMQSKIKEGKSPHKKGTAKYKKHMAAIHANEEDNLKVDMTGHQASTPYKHQVFGGNKGIAVQAFKRLNYVIDGLSKLDIDKTLDKDTQRRIFSQIEEIRTMLAQVQVENQMKKDYNRIYEVANRIWALDVQRPLSEDVKRTAISNIKLATEAWKNRYTKQYNEALSLPPEADAKWLEKQIRASARKNGIDPNVAVRVWKSEGGMNYQSQIPRKGKGSMGGKESSYGPFQLYTGGGLGNEYENEYGVDLTQDNTLSGLQRQINFAMNKASQGGWTPWYGAAKAGIGPRDGIDDEWDVSKRRVSTQPTRSGSSISSFGAAFKTARAKHGGPGGMFTWNGKQYQTNVKGEKYIKNPVSVDIEEDSSLNEEMSMWDWMINKYDSTFWRGIGSSGKGTGLGALGKGVYLSWEEGMAKAFAGPNGAVAKYKVKPGLNMLDVEDKDFIDIKAEMGMQPWEYSDDPMFAGMLTMMAKEKGYDGIVSDDVATGIVIFDENNVEKQEIKESPDDPYRQSNHVVSIDHTHDGTTMHIFKDKKGGYYGDNNKFDFHRDNAKDMVRTLKDWGYNEKNILVGKLPSDKSMSGADEIRQRIRQLGEEKQTHGDFELKDIAPELRPAVRQAMVKFPMAKDRLSAVIRMMQQDNEKDKKNTKDIGRLDKENDVQDVDIDTAEIDIEGLLARIDKLEQTVNQLSQPELTNELRIERPDVGNWGIPRDKMPQVHKDNYPEFLDYLSDNGVTFNKTTMPASDIKPIQSEFSDAGVVKALVKRKTKKPSILSSDNYIIDGHHRWLASLNTGNDILVYKTNVPANQLLELVLKFPKTYFKGIYKENAAGRIVKGVNTTQDVGVNQTSIEAAKFGSKLKNGKPPLLHKKALKNSDPNTLSNLGLAEEKINERGGISVPISSGLSVPIAPHRQLKIKKSTKGRHFYENPKKSNRTKSNRGDTI